MTIEAFINRLLVLYGAPESADDGMFIDEYRDILSQVDSALLRPAGNIIRDTHSRRGWPTPAEVKSAISKAGYLIAATPLPGAPSDDDFERVGPEDPRFVRALTLARVDTPAYAQILERRGWIKVCKESVGPRLAATKNVLTDLSRRMTGDRES